MYRSSAASAIVSYGRLGSERQPHSLRPSRLVQISELPPSQLFHAKSILSPIRATSRGISWSAPQLLELTVGYGGRPGWLRAVRYVGWRPVALPARQRS